MKAFTIVAAAAGLISSVAGHGLVTSPPTRKPGAGLRTACGDGVFNTLNSDPYGNVQGAMQNLQGSHPDCRIWQCKGMPFSDHGEIQSYTPGEKVNMKVEIRAPHDGKCNVSIVSAATDKIIGQPLISFDKYALTSVPMSQHPEWTDFSFEMPDVSAECPKEGDCFIQWFWDAPAINQSYESCVDFTMGSGSGTGTSTPPVASPSSSAPAVPQTTPTTPSGSGSNTGSGSGSNTGSGSGSNTGSGSGSNTGSGSGSNTGSGSGSNTGSGSGSGSELPKTFTIDSFITWLRANAGTGAADKLRRMASVGRVHPRAFRD